MSTEFDKPLPVVPLADDEKMDLLRTSSFLSQLPADLLSVIAQTAVERYLKQGEYIYVPGDESESLFLLISGQFSYPEVQIRGYSSAMAHNNTAQPGQIFGIGAVLDPRLARIISARCESDSVVLTMNGPDLRRLCLQHGEAGQALLEQLASVYAGYEHGVGRGRSGWISIRDVSLAGKLENCSLELRTGEFCAVHCTAGSGKTELARIISGRQAPDSGAVYIDGDLFRHQSWVRTAPDPVALIEARSSAGAFSRAFTHRRSHKTSSEAQAVLAGHGFSESDNDPVLLDLAERLVNAFLGPYRALVLDDPFRRLGPAERLRLHQLCLALWHNSQRTVLLLTSDSEESLALADRVMLLREQPGHLGAGIPVNLPRPRSADVLSSPEGKRISRHLQQSDLKHPNLTVRPTADPAGQKQPMTPDVPAGHNAIRNSLVEGRFFWTLEYVPSVDKVLRDDLQKIAGLTSAVSKEPILAGFSITDRVHSDWDPNPIAAGAQLRDVSGKQPLVHLSGKDRDIEDLEAALTYHGASRLENVLLVSGDRLKHEPGDRRPRYLESVCAIKHARQLRPDLLIGAAMCPFKYTEEAGMAQYLKLGKKIAAGADVVFTQLGWDMRKYEELMYWVDSRHHGVPIVANVMSMSAARARYIRGHDLAGVTVTDSFMHLLEAEEKMFPDKGAARNIRRLALQMVGLKQFGFAGVQLTGISSPERLAALNSEVVAVEQAFPDRLRWRRAWTEAFTLPDAGQADPAPPGEPWYLSNRTTGRRDTKELRRYRLMSSIHKVCFGEGGLARPLSGICRWAEHRGGLARNLLFWLENAAKSPVGCEACGSCRLAWTQFICPETCPKGLANGSCGGSTGNRCEFGDRECIHVRRYRIARDTGRLDEMETWLVPPVPAANRGRSSWIAHFNGDVADMTVVRPVGDIQAREARLQNLNSPITAGQEHAPPSSDPPS